MLLHAFDIETTGLDPNEDVILSVAFTTDNGDHHVLTGGERQLLVDLEDLVQSFPAGAIVTWNGAVFDLPFVADRASQHRVKLSLRLVPDPQVKVKYCPLPGHQGGYRARWGVHQHVDIASAFETAAAAAGVPWGLKPVARLYGIDVIELDREHLSELVEAGQLDQVVAYNCSDTDATLTLARTLEDLTALTDRV